MRILIEPAALMHVIGTTMDFVEDRIKCVLVWSIYASPRTSSTYHYATSSQVSMNLELNSVILSCRVEL